MTNSIIRIISGDSFPADTHPLAKTDLKNITKENGGLFNWLKELKPTCRQIFKLIIRNIDVIQGLLSISKYFRMKTKILLLAILFISVDCSGQANTPGKYFLIENIKSEHDDSYSIPLIKSQSSPHVAEKVNQIIQLTTVGKSYNVVGKGIFDEMLNENGQGTVSMGYTILQNSEAILSIRFSDETMSSYPDYHTFYLNFNSATGDIVDLEELFNRSGIDHINDIASSTFNKVIKNYHTEVLRDSAMESEQRSEIFDYVFDLTECNANHEVWKYGFTQEAIIVEKDRCFPHVIQAFDIEWSCTIKVKDLFSDDFTNYGKNLLQNNKTDKSINYNIKNNLMSLYGKIDNKHQFCMYLTLNADNSIGGYYWYTKFGKLLDFKGKRISNNKIELTESAGKFIININDNGEITGNWYNKDGKSVPITFY